MSDLFIGKPGGLTTAESLASGLPWSSSRPSRPGGTQQRPLLEKGIALKCNEFTTLAYKIDGLLDQPAQLAAMRERALAYSRPNAAAPSSTRSSISAGRSRPGRARRNVISSQAASLKYVGPFSQESLKSANDSWTLGHLYGLFSGIGKTLEPPFSVALLLVFGWGGATRSPHPYLLALRFSAFCRVLSDMARRKEACGAV